MATTTTDDDEGSSTGDDDSTALVTPLSSPLIRREGSGRLKSKSHHNPSNETRTGGGGGPSSANVNGIAGTFNSGQSCTLSGAGDIIASGGSGGGGGGSVHSSSSSGGGGGVGSTTEQTLHHRQLRRQGSQSSKSSPLLTRRKHSIEKSGGGTLGLAGSGGGVHANPNASSSLPSPGLQRSDSVKYCRSANGSAPRTGPSAPSGGGGSGGGGPHPSMHPGSSTPPRPSRRVPSLKLKRFNVAARAAVAAERQLQQQQRQGLTTAEDSSETASVTTVSTTPTSTTITATATSAGNVSTKPGGGHPTTMPFLLQVGNNAAHPSITITLDSDSDSIYSDYLSPDINYQNNVKVQFLGDEASLYGTPKEELIPNPVEMQPNDQKPSPTTYLKDQILTFFQPSDNKLAMKLFGNKNALMKEKMRHKSVGNWVIHPCSNFRLETLFFFSVSNACLFVTLRWVVEMSRINVTHVTNHESESRLSRKRSEINNI